jgi:hypothetical protein
MHALAGLTALTDLNLSFGGKVSADGLRALVSLTALTFYCGNKHFLSYD